MTLPLNQGRGLLALGLLLSLAAVVLWRSTQTPRPMPVDAVSRQAGWADEQSCLDCHEQATTFAQTGHAQTLRPATAALSLELLKRVAENSLPGEEKTTLRIGPEGVFAINQEGPQSKQIELDWCFGSGHHACTWTSTMPDSSGATDQLEFRWTWYHGDIIDVTPGQPAQPTPGYFGKLGVLHDGPKSMRCFSCHADYVPADQGQIAESQIKPGISCQRCHGPRQAHVASEGSYSDPHWQFTDRMQAVERCGQCHRRADELPPEEISTDNISIVRFQPVGLVQSKCFTHSEMTCTTCHDPHLPVAAQDTRGIWQCIQCHDPHKSDHVLCGAGESERCLGCHMPKVKMDSPIHFTDHWIRVRDMEANAP